jgi:uncharacterized membrane protein
MDNAALIGGIVGGSVGLLCIVAVIVGVVCASRRRRAADGHQTRLESSTSSIKPESTQDSMSSKQSTQDSQYQRIVPVPDDYAVGEIN